MAVKEVYQNIKVHNPVGLVSAALYLLSVPFGIIVAVPVGITLRNFDGMCVLYAQVVWDNAHIYSWSDESCDFVMFFAIGACVIYAILMAGFTLFAVLPRTMEKQKLIGAVQAYHTNFILESMNPVFTVINIVMAMLTLMSAVVITVGFAQFCNDLVVSMKAVDEDFNSCYKAQDVDWSHISVIGGSKGPRGHNFHVCLTVAMIGSWALFIIWFLQMGLNFRYCCRGFTCGIAEEKQRGSKSQTIAMRRSRMATPIGTPGGHMTPRAYPPPHAVHYQMGSQPQVSLGPLPPKGGSSHA